jgi:hypothetical protein
VRGGGIEPVIRRGTTSTGIGGSFTAGVPAFPTTEAYLFLYIMDISRGAITNAATVATYSMLTYGSLGPLANHVARRMLMTHMRSAQNTISAWTGGNIEQGGAYTKTQDETTGTFDSMNLWWQNAANPIEIAAYGAVKIF